MNLKSLSDAQLLEATKTLVAREREVITSILWHLEEIERRRLFSDLGCSSIYAYAAQVLGYSEDQAYRRISAMRLLRTMPELESKIQAGHLSVSNLSLAQTMIRREAKATPLTPEKKRELVSRLENKTSREAQVIALDYSSTPTTVAPEKERPLSEQLVELKLAIPKSTLEKIYRLRGLRAHRTPHLSTAELLDQLCDLALKHWNPGVGDAKINEVTKEQGTNGEVTKSGAGNKNNELLRSESTKESEPNSKSFSRSIPTRTVRQVWRRDRSECKLCGSQHALQVDHVHPWAWGGNNDENNLRLLCRSCNQRQAIKKMGMKKMARYLETRKSNLTGKNSKPAQTQFTLVVAEIFRDGSGDPGIGEYQNWQRPRRDVPSKGSQRKSKGVAEPELENIKNWKSG